MKLSACMAEGMTQAASQQGHVIRLTASTCAVGLNVLGGNCKVDCWPFQRPMSYSAFLPHASDSLDGRINTCQNRHRALKPNSLHQHCNAGNLILHRHWLCSQVLMTSLPKLLLMHGQMAAKAYDQAGLAGRE